MTRAKLESAVVEAMAQAGRDVMQWGRDDCALWTANILRSVCGFDPAQDYRGRYKTRNGARKALGPKGLLGAARKAARRYKWVRIDPNAAQPGDIGLVWTEVEVPGKASVPVLATVICRARGWFVGRNDTGFTAVEAKHVPIAWSVLDDCQAGARANLGNPAGLRRPFAQHVAHEPISLGALALAALGVELTAASLFIANAVIFTAVSAGVSFEQEIRA